MDYCLSFGRWTPDGQVVSLWAWLIDLEGKMSEVVTPKTQEEWLEHFKELAEEHGEMLARPFIDFFADKIVLTKKEVEEAREVTYGGCLWFLNYDAEKCKPHHPSLGFSADCRLCKKLTLFAQGEEDE